MAKTDLVQSEEEMFALADDLRSMASEDSNKGSENVTSNDIAIPYISILQALSPQVSEGAPEQIPGAKAGMFFQNVNVITWDGKTGLDVVPFAYDRNILQWTPREKGGGLVGVHDLNTPLMAQAKPNDKNIPTLPDGTNLIDTAQHYVLYNSPISGAWEPAIVSMKSSSLKKSRLWNSLISQQMIPGTEQTAPRWLYKWHLTTVIEAKDANRWFNFEIAREGFVDKAIYLKAKSLHEAFRSGKMAADIAAAHEASQKTDGDNIPF